MTKVTLLGDSIRQIGYGRIVPKLLGDSYTVFQPPENCKFSKYTLRGLYEWRNDMKGSDIIHWNNGLWDTCISRPDDEPFTSPEEYTSNIIRIAKWLKNNHREVIFATTTPVHPKNVFEDNDRIIYYNSLVVPELKNMGVIINDLHSLIAVDPIKYIRNDDLIHLTDEAIELCANQVAKYIRSAAEKL